MLSGKWFEEMNNIPQGSQLEEGVFSDTTGTPCQPEKEVPGSFIKKMRDILFHPILFFASLPPEEKKGFSLSFAITAGSIGLAGLVFWQGLFDQLFFSDPVKESLGSWVYISIILLGIILFPFLIALQQFVLSGILHLFLRIFGANPGSYNQTFKVVAYSQAPLVWGIVPLIGGIIGAIWSIILQVIGIKSVHHLSWGKVILSFLLPFLVLSSVGIIIGWYLPLIIDR